jgi:hypothetical protein
MKEHHRITASTEVSYGEWDAQRLNSQVVPVTIETAGSHVGKTTDAR